MPAGTRYAAIGIVALYALVNPQTMWLKFSPSRMPQTY
jgi:hypothetical protein